MPCVNNSTGSSIQIPMTRFSNFDSMLDDLKKGTWKTLFLLKFQRGTLV